MQAIVIKYVQLICIVFLFENVKCDTLSLDGSQDDVLLNRWAGCTAACMIKNVTAVCMEDLLNTNLNHRLFTI